MYDAETLATTRGHETWLEVNYISMMMYDAETLATTRGQETWLEVN